jgi:hypothetical protein
MYEEDLILYPELEYLSMPAILPEDECLIKWLHALCKLRRKKLHKKTNNRRKTTKNIKLNNKLAKK